MIVIVTGASSGIGLATAKLFAKNGNKVIGLSRHQNTEIFENFESIACDMTNYAQVMQVYAEIEKKYGKIDVLVNNAGMGIAGAIEYTEMQDVEKQFNLNLLAVINSCKCIAPIMRKQGGGKIINIGSLAGIFPIAFQACYATSKAAIDMFSMSFANEVSNFGIKVSVVCPGDTKTGFTASRVKTEILQDENYKERIFNSITKMEEDEKNGKPPESVAKVVFKLANKKNPESRVMVGFGNKFLVFLNRFMPRKFMIWVVRKMYG